MSPPRSSPPLSGAFNEDHARVYDSQFAALSGIKACIHLLTEACLGGLPDHARILIAGAGTGAEARYLAPRFPGWRFTLVDPSAPMLAIARAHAEAEGFAGRCSFHAAYVSDTPMDAHDGAPSLLVSHFLTEAPARQAYFADIAARMKPGGRLVANAVTLEGEQVLASAHATFGGELSRIAVSHAEPVGERTGWRSAMAVTQWSKTKA